MDRGGHRGTSDRRGLGEPGAVSDVRWLGENELEAWRRLQLMHLQLTAALSRELAEAADLSYQDYLVLAALTDRPDGRMRAFELSRELGW